MVGGMYGRGGMHGRGWGRTWQERRPLQWTVRIMLECIFVKRYGNGGVDGTYTKPYGLFTHTINVTGTGTGNMRNGLIY